AKFSAILLLPMCALAAAVWLAGRVSTEGWLRPLLRLVRSAALHAIVAWALIWTFFDFRFGPFAPALADGANYNHGWAWMTEGLGWPRPVLLGLQKWHVLPDAFLYGFTFVLQFAKQRGAFLNGEYSIHGWTVFFPYAFLVKTTLPFLALVVVGAIAAGRKLGAAGGRLAWTRVRPFTPLIALFVVYWATSLASHLNIGHRHILPTYPVLFIVAGAFGAWLEWRRPLAAGFVAAMVVWHAAESWRIRPHYLAYFNPIAGGPAGGWRHLVDSSIDWGQDLPGLRAWLETHAPREKVFLSYFGTGDPVYEGIRATLMPTLPEAGPPRPWYALSAGVYAISATMLQQVYSPVSGHWSLAREKEYQDLRVLEPQFLEYQNDPVRRAALLREAPVEQWNNGWKRYELLRFARLCTYLRVRRTDAAVGYSILIYRVTQPEIDVAVNGSLRDWTAAIEAAVRND
ncbi:MAG: hypothetical protein ABIR80_08165, partial [Opitutaceae bacterium]